MTGYSSRKRLLGYREERHCLSLENTLSSSYKKKDNEVQINIDSL